MALMILCFVLAKIPSWGAILLSSWVELEKKFVVVVVMVGRMDAMEVQNGVAAAAAAAVG